ncbi:MAG: hypothetical protein K8I02_11735, partial [Candidatus Methylomirabilis sp.]|nr:hypothetical protein [Deltaproteobacteria bacterium]
MCALGAAAALLAAPARADDGAWRANLSELHAGLDASRRGLDAVSFGLMAMRLDALLDLRRAGEAGDYSDVRFADLHRLALEARKAGRAGPQIDVFEEKLRALDYAQHAAHGFRERPSTRWMVAYGKGLRPGGERVDDGWISRATRKVCIDARGVPQGAEAVAKKICDTLTYDEYTARIPDVKPREVLAFSDEVPGQVLNDRIRE